MGSVNRQSKGNIQVFVKHDEGILNVITLYSTVYQSEYAVWSNRGLQERHQSAHLCKLCKRKSVFTPLQRRGICTGTVHEWNLFIEKDLRVLQTEEYFGVEDVKVGIIDVELPPSRNGNVNCPRLFICEHLRDYDTDRTKPLLRSSSSKT